ncbi:SDR family oxidoreductase [Eisenibacter elegans]|jgi:NAD(P)H dehydrogenase (quinone)|uniref:SDR family oxidoreductase n=1 Tax=Eisenibacter elegans TaxID=997 RepID=UPI0004183843|nr:SDR family oxidoreductase [Eisenibacter elegans]
MSEKILITGANGQLGRAVIAYLLPQVPQGTIAGLVRKGHTASDLAALGVDIREGDYFDQASLTKAMQGIDKVLLISSSDFNDRFGQHRNVIDAAHGAGVKHLYYTGVTIKDIKHSALNPLLADHFQTEDYIKSKGFTYTFLRNGLYAEVIPMFLGEQVLQTGVYFPAGSGSVAFVARQDLGEATANILASAGHDNKTYSLTSSQVYSFQDVADILTTLSGQTVGYYSPASEEYKAMLSQLGLPEPVVMMSVLFAEGMKNNDFNEADHTLETLLGRKQIDLQTFLKGVYGL